MAARSEYLANTGVFWVGSALAVFAAIVTIITVPNIGADWMIEEEAKFRQYLLDHGYDISQMGDEDFVETPAVPYSQKAETEHNVMHEKQGASF